MNKPTILFFARGYQVDFFPKLISDKYDSIFVTLTKSEKQKIERNGISVIGCFEEDFDKIEIDNTVNESYLDTSFMSDRFLGHFSFEDRNRILNKEIAFWGRIFAKYKPNAVVNELVAIEISEVLMIEARKRNIKYLAGMNCVVYDYFYWLPNPLTISGKFLPNISPSDQSILKAKEYLREVYEKSYKPFYVKNLPSRYNLKLIISAVVKLCLIKSIYFIRGLNKKFFYENYTLEYKKRLIILVKGLFNKYDSIEKISSDVEVIFYPLHQEPEATLNYMSEFYSNQCSTIENILKCLNENQILVVKEHPVDKGALLMNKFLELRRKYSGLYFIPAEVHGRQVLEKTSRVVTLTSTVGWEAFVLGKKVYVLGEIFYDNIVGADFISDFKKLKEVLRKPVIKNPIKQDELVHFIAQMVEISYRGNPFPFKDLYSKENINNVIEAVYNEVA